jgi:pimeloyl-ACP methyl ester carboxylesterase
MGGSFYADTINYYRLEHDIVLIDVRGTGGSNALHCRQLQLKRNLADQLGEMYPAELVRDCYDSLSQIADLTQYTTTNMAIDVEEARKWLGYKKINIFGLSFGTRLAQVYMKMFPESVESVVLESPTTTYSKLPLYHAPFAEEAIAKLFADCKSDSACNATFPEIKREFSELKKRGQREPFAYKLRNEEGETTNITIPWHSFETKIRGLMYRPTGLRRLPYIIHEASKGNWQPFVDLYPTESSYNNFIAEGLYLSLTCTEDVPFITQREIDSLTAGTFMGDYRVRSQIGACDNWTSGSVPDGYFDPLQSDIPTLVFSGYFDPVTPPSMASQIIKTLPKNFHIVIPSMSHVFEGLSNEACFDRMVVDFFKKPDQKPNVSCIDSMLPPPYKTK